MAYGDVTNVTTDARTLIEILSRQGSGIFLEVLADHLGEMAVKFKLPPAEVHRVRSATVAEYIELVNERT